MDAIQTITSHQSIRRFTGESISDAQLRAIDSAIMQTSSSCFLQLVSVIRISDKEKLRRLAELSGDQQHIAECSHFLMFCIDLTKLMHLGLIKPPFSFHTLFMGINDCSIACQNAYTAAESLGLGGVIIGGYKSGIREVSEMLKLPKGVAPLLGLCLGVPDKEYLEEQKPRLPENWIIMDEEWSDAFDADVLKKYDASMLEYYDNRKYNRKGALWSEASAYMLSHMTPEYSANIVKYLKEQGFDFV